MEGNGATSESVYGILPYQSKILYECPRKYKRGLVLVKSAVNSKCPIRTWDLVGNAPSIFCVYNLCGSRTRIVAYTELFILIAEVVLFSFLFLLK